VKRVRQNFGREKVTYFRKMVSGVEQVLVKKLSTSPTIQKM